MFRVAILTQLQRAALAGAPLHSSFRSLSSLSSFSSCLQMTTAEFKQAPHKLLVIPGPIEVTDEVLYANAAPSLSHVSPEFIKIFGDAIRLTRDVLFTKDGQPFLISGSGTLGWDQVAANLVEPRENALVLNSGYFGDSFQDCLQTYGAKVDMLKAELGTPVSQDRIEEALKSKKYKIITVTHVDTSTGVLSDIKAVAATAKRVSPETLVVVDGVCSVGSEEIRFDEWGLDIVLTASQKGLGTPPGLSIIVASQRAIKTFQTRSAPVSSYYGGWHKWLSIMRAYEGGSPAYFATPPVNLINAYHASLVQLTKGLPSLEERFELHRKASQRVKAVATELGLKQIALDPAFAANGMTTLYYPDGLGASDIIPRFAQRGLVIAGGLLGSIKDKYFRIGHMGATVADPSRGDIETIINALRDSIMEAREQKA